MPTFPRDKNHTHIVSPLIRVLEKGFYYIVAIDENGSIRHFRMDRMTSTAIINEKNESLSEANWKNMNWESYVNSSFGLGMTANPYSYQPRGGRGIDNQSYTVHLRLTRDLVGVVMDRFGSDVTITPEDKGHFIAVINVYHNALFVSWILSLGNKVKILEPERLVDDIAYYAQETGRWHKRSKED
jgi:predicted DNA-binding transcriptional regulator YafY